MDKIDSYISSQASPQKEICEALRKLILKTFPKITEQMKWGVPTFGDGKFYLVGLKDHVNLGFSLQGLSKKEQALFDGGGKTMKHLEFSKLREIDEKKIVKLLLLVWEKR